MPDTNGTPPSLKQRTQPSKPLGEEQRDTVYMEVTLDRLQVDAQNVRKAFAKEALDELANTLKRDGVLQPLVVRPDPAKAGHYFIIAGERRFRAAQLAALKTVPVIVRHVEKVRGLQLIENLHRSELNPLEKADGIAAVMEEEGLDEKAVSARLGFENDREVRRYLQLHRAPDLIRSAVRDGVRVEVERDGSRRTVLGMLDYRSALEVLRIYNHLAKADASEDKWFAQEKTEKLLKRAIAETWSKADFEAYAAALGKGRSVNAARARRGMFQETGSRLVIDLKRVAERKENEVSGRDALIAKLEAILLALRSEGSIATPGIEG